MSLAFKPSIRFGLIMFWSRLLLNMQRINWLAPILNIHSYINYASRFIWCITLWPTPFLLQLFPFYPHNIEVLLNDLKSPSESLDFGDFSDCIDSGTGGSRPCVVNPAFDYVPPQLVNLFITDTWVPAFLYGNDGCVNSFYLQS